MEFLNRGLILTNRSVFLIYLLIFFGVSAPATGQESPCRQKIIKICDVDGANPVCKLLHPSGRPETPQSIRVFLSGLASLDETMRQDLICARLMGRRTIVNLQTEIGYSREPVPAGELSQPSRYIFKVNDYVLSGSNIWHLAMPKEYIRLVEGHRELDKLKKSANKGITLDFEGLIVDVEPYYSEAGTLRGLKIKIDSVVLSQVKTPYSTGDMRTQSRAVQEMIKRAYEEYMTTGFD